MQSLRQLGAGFVMIFAFLLLVLGAFSISLMEGGLTPPAPVTVTPSPALAAGELPTLPALPILQSPTSQPTASPSPTLPPPPTNCPPPIGWQGVIVQPFDTLESLAASYQVSAADIIQQNCLLSTNLMPGSILYLPVTATSTTAFFLPSATIRACGPPPTWTATYIVQQGDTLFKISVLYRVTVTQLQQANCLVNINQITPGQVLRVPNVATSTPSATPLILIFPTNTPSPTASASPTPTPPPPTTSAPPTAEPPSATPTASNTPVP